MFPIVAVWFKFRPATILSLFCLLFRACRIKIHSGPSPTFLPPPSTTLHPCHIFVVFPFSPPRFSTLVSIHRRDEKKKKRDKLVERFHAGSFFFIIIIIVFFCLIFYSPEGETYLLGDFFLQFKLLRFGRLFVKGFFHFSYWMIFSLLFFFFVRFCFEDKLWRFY